MAPGRKSQEHNIKIQTYPEWEGCAGRRTSAVNIFIRLTDPVGITVDDGKNGRPEAARNT
ncbi:hypothetical protein PSCICP_05710 [Pseudomonas cichorii]|uniref:Uncharacterized protein n=1 Tax=Pseudomonas cichorii TaxID=36746 RepID=A0ABQ1DHV6_PSECI|nr:hypothetical protein PSCICP_05710 [Pseudomonas cichorii]